MSLQPLIIALPKGRILDEALPIVRRAGIEPEAALADDSSRALQFSTNLPYVRIIRVRSFDVATFVAFGAAHLGIAGNRLSIAQRADMGEDLDLSRLSHVRIATKYPNITSKWFAEHGIQAECVKLNGAMELAPALGLCPRIVDLVSTGETLKANGLKESATIAQVSSRLIVNRTALKVRSEEISGWIERFRSAVAG